MKECTLFSSFRLFWNEQNLMAASKVKNHRKYKTTCFGMSSAVMSSIHDVKCYNGQKQSQHFTVNCIYNIDRRNKQITCHGISASKIKFCMQIWFKYGF